MHREIEVLISAKHKYVQTSVYKIIKAALAEHNIMVNVDIDEERYMIPESEYPTSTRAEYISEHGYVVTLRTLV